MSHAWWHFWGGNKANASTSSDLPPNQYINDGSNLRIVEGNVLDENSKSIYGPNKGELYRPDLGLDFNTGEALPEMFRNDQIETEKIINESIHNDIYKENRVDNLGDIDVVANDGVLIIQPEETTEEKVYKNPGDNYYDYRSPPPAKQQEPVFKIGDWSNNVLDELDNPTYHLTLWIDNKQFVNREMHDRQGVIIAETGSTTYFTIDNLEISSPIAGSHVITNAAPIVTWTLTEPNGAAFFPKLMDICDAKGISNLQEAGYALEVRFKGRDKTTGEPKMAKQKWLYKLAVTAVTTKHGIEGSTYSFRAAHMHDTASKASWNNPHETITVTNSATLGEVMKGLETQLNKYHNRIALKSSSKPDTVKIVLANPAWKSWKLKPPTGSAGNLNKPEKSDWTLDAGSSVKDFMIKLMMHTQEMEDRMDEAGVDIKIDTREKLGHVKEFYIKYFKIKTDVEIGTLWNDSMKKFNEDCTYTIQAFNELPPEKQARYEQIVKSSKLQKQKIAKIKELDLLKKRYDYLHTGLNTQVLQFDTNIVMSFIRPEVAYGGKTSYNVKAIDADIPEATIDGNPSKESEILRTLAQIENEIEAALKERTKQGNLEQELVRERDELLAQVEEAMANGGGKMSKPSELAKLEKRIKDARAGMETADGKLDLLQDQKQERLSQDYANAIKMNDVVDAQYLGDINLEGKSNVTRKYRPTYAKRTTQVDNGALQETAKQNMEASGDMINVEIGIKGDPYWLGPPATASGWQGGSGSSGRSFEIVDRELADYDIGPQMFLFSMFFPDPEHNSKPYFNKLYSGVYKAMTVIHQMRGGQFTQFLTGVRETTITEENVKMLVDALKPQNVSTGDNNGVLQDKNNDEGLNGVAGDGATVAPAGEVPATVSGREQQVMDRLINKHGLTPAQAAGIVGNLNKESALRTGARNPGDGNDGSDSIGIAQWNSTRADNLKAFAASRGVSHLDLNTQADFIMHELKGSGAYGGGSESGAWNRLKNATNEQSAAEAFTYYERFKDYNVAGNHETISRKSQSSRILNEYYSKAQEDNSGIALG